MYNTDFPDRADLPSTAKLITSTILAGVAAVAILITLVLPSEYGIDPTGVGSLLGLKTMGEIKVQLAQEAAGQAAAPATVAQMPPAVSAPSAAVAALEQRVTTLEAILAPALEAAPQEPDPSYLETPAPLETQAPQTAPVEAPTELAVAEPVQSGWRDVIKFVLTPGQGTEYKLVMAAGAVANYEFSVDGGVINFDAHGEGTGQSAKYEQGRAVPAGSGALQPQFDGTHGWFFRNRGDQDVVVTLRTGGDYVELRKLI